MVKIGTLDQGIVLFLFVAPLKGATFPWVSLGTAHRAKGPRRPHRPHGDFPQAPGVHGLRGQGREGDDGDLSTRPRELFAHVRPSNGKIFHPHGSSCGLHGVGFG